MSLKDDKKKKQQAGPEEAVEEQTPVEEPAEEAQPDPTEELKAQLDAVNDKFLRTLAEYDNFRKRSQREKDALYADAVCDTAAKFLPVLDSFERALSAACADAEYSKGVEMISTTFKETLGTIGVSEIEALGKPFDPNTQNAVMHVDDDSAGEGVVVEVFQKGYILKEKVLRHAMVKVAN